MEENLISLSKKIKGTGYQRRAIFTIRKARFIADKKSCF
ncbi:hypothetical protein Chls_875 [Chlamydia suis]|uniref:Transposase n=1 Tax=Chlamydia suis TaxID=83559 RepID=A0ABX6ITT3_9CHLA|nr:hypothetical protein Chls_875 [Chlamydia suis]